MTISRALMGSQLKGTKMRKRTKKAIGGLIGALAQGDVRGAVPGVVPALLLEREKRKEQARALANDGVKGPAGVTGMRKGGPVSRGDGACIKGHTKGKLR